MARAKPALERRLLRRVPGVATMAVLVIGCTTRPVVLDAPRPGEIVARAGRVGVVVGTPSPGEGVGEVAGDVARLTGFGLVVAQGDGAAYERKVREVARGALVFYVEVHGGDRRESAERIDVAAGGVDADEAVKLRILLELVRDAHLRGRPAGVRLDVRVRSVATASGLARASQRSLSIDVPRLARQQARDLYAHILAEFLREAVALPLPARR